MGLKNIHIDEILWQDIPQDLWPPAGAIHVCLDPQKRLGPETWSVSIMGDGTLEGDTVQMGLFWSKANALLFAKALNNTEAYNDHR